MREILLNFVQLLCDLIVGSLPYREGSPSTKPKLVAHRGAWSRKFIENTLDAFWEAKSLGADAIELDVHFTSDNVPVVHHDEDLVRLYGHKTHIRDVTFGALRALVPGVPTLAEVLEIRGLHFFVEIKTQLDNEQIVILEGHLSQLEPVRDFHLLALDPGLVRISTVLAPKAWILVGELMLGRLVNISVERGLGGVAGHYVGMTNRLVERLREANQISGVGFISTKNLFNREWSRGMDFVFTNSTTKLSLVSSE